MTLQASFYYEVYSCLDPEGLLERKKHNICERRNVICRKWRQVCILQLSEGFHNFWKIKLLHWIMKTKYLQENKMLHSSAPYYLSVLQTSGSQPGAGAQLSNLQGGATRGFKISFIKQLNMGKIYYKCIIFFTLSVYCSIVVCVDWPPFREFNFLIGHSCRNVLILWGHGVVPGELEGCFPRGKSNTTHPLPLQFSIILGAAPSFDVCWWYAVQRDKICCDCS